MDREEALSVAQEELAELPIRSFLDAGRTVYTLNQFHSYDWLAWNAAFAAMLLATGLGARRNGMLPTPLAWATIVIGASLLTPLGFFGFILVPVWLIVVGVWLSRAKNTSPAAVQASPLSPCPALPLLRTRGRSSHHRVPPAR